MPTASSADAEELNRLVIHWILLLACAAAIYASCEYFVNAIEWLGIRLHMHETAVGTVLAAFGTALPESVVTGVAVITGHSSEAKGIGIGAAMGGPLVLATIAYGVAGLAMLGASRSAPQSFDGTNLHKLARDQGWFLCIFAAKVTLGFVAFALKPALGAAFFAAYVLYCWRELRAETDDTSPQDPEPLKLRPRSQPPDLAAVLLQTVAALVVIFTASELFVRQLDVLGPMIGVPSTVTALLLAPIATELPEIINAVIWVRQRKPNLALANIAGSMMIQATVPSGLGILFTTWRFDDVLLWSGLVTAVSIAYLHRTIRSSHLTAARLAAAAVPYLGFLAGVVALRTL